MKYLLLFTFLCCSLFGFSQSKEDSLIRVAIDGFFKGLNTQDAEKIRAVIRSDMSMKTVVVDESNTTKIHEEQLADFLETIETPREEIWEERILEYTIKIDGPMAMAWLPYEFYFEGEYSHEGVDLLVLIKENNQWKIASIMDTRRRNPEKQSDAVEE